MRFLVPGLFIVIALSGCANVADDAAETTQSVAGDALATARTIGGPRERTLEGLTEAADGVYDLSPGREVVLAAACDALCSPLRISVGALPDADDWFIDARIYWDGTASGAFDVHLEEAGERVADSRRGFDMARAVLWAPEGSVYDVVIEGEGEFTGDIRLRNPDVPALPGNDRLPNLVTLTPAELSISDCHAEEQAEEGAERCLRLGNSVGNVGDGPLEVHLSYTQGAMAAGAAGEFVQRIYQDGGWRDAPASGAEIHPVHGHFHYAGLAHFKLYEYDEATGQRGSEVAAGNKRGFCFLDWGDMDHPEAPSGGQQRAESECLIPKFEEGWSMGITRGMYDYYWPELADQYIDVAGVPDGTYELVSIADGANTLLETDETDNDASLIITLTGDEVGLLEIRSLYDNPEGVPI